MTVIKHSNGNYSVWSTIVDDFTFINITKEEYITMKLEEYTKEIKQELEKVDKGFNTTVMHTLDERLEILEKVHGKERRVEVEKMFPKE